MVAETTRALEAFSKCRVFHGTNKENAVSIRRNGFDIKKAQDVDFYTGNKTLLGKAVYFAPDRFKAAHLAKEKFGEDHAIVLEYILDTGNMLTTGSACRNWHKKFDTCYLVGKLSKRTQSENAPKPTKVHFDEIAVSSRVLATNLTFVQQHAVHVDKPYTKECYEREKRNSVSSRSSSWKQWTDADDSGDDGTYTTYTPEWYREEGKKYKKKKRNTWSKRLKKKIRNTPRDFRAQKPAKVDLSDVVSTKSGKYVASTKRSGRKIASLPTREKQHHQQFEAEKSVKEDANKIEAKGGTMYVVIPDYLLCPKGYISGPAEISHSSDESRDEDDDASDHSVSMIEDCVPENYTLGPPPSSNASETKGNTIDRRAFGVITSSNIPSASNLVKSDPGKYMVVSGSEIREAGTIEGATGDPDTGSSNSFLMSTMDKKKYPAAMPELATFKNESVVPSMNAPLLFTSVISLGMPLRTIRYVSAPIVPLVFPPPPLIPVVVSSPKPDIAPICLNSPERKEISGFGGKGC